FEIIVSQIGNYTLSSTSNPYCPGTVSGSATVTEVDVELSITPLNVLCNGENTGSVSLSVLSGDPTYSFQWSNNEVVQNPTNLSAGTYSVTVTDNNGCTETISTEITEPPALEIDLQIATPIDCNGSFTGALDLTVNGGVPNYFYNWQHGSGLEDPSQLPAGTYSVVVT